ncbi:MAG: hypothetical protein HF978_04400 [Desulfobacteraceae bacterium]|nr:hypothetical protein [Desulfobacteraceae bacterium]MBC2754769.1 hypothetical protein [Desulfobacteraceae bacterium]
MKRLALFLTMLFACSLFLAAGAGAVDNVLNMTDVKTDKIFNTLAKLDLENEEDQEKAKEFLDKWDLSIVTLSGKINHFGYNIFTGKPIDYHATVPGVSVWIAEYPCTRYLNFQSDETGWWTITVIKYKNEDLKFSFVYEKQGWVTTKCNVITVTDEDNVDIAIQYIDPYYYYLALKPAVEAMIGVPLVNAMVVTVGKSWASMHDDRLPHGDPGATVSSIPVLTYPETIGPIYFNEAVQPDPTYPYTSVDGGVTWINVPLNTYYVTAHKDGINYETVRFNLTEADVENGVELYIASPPDSVQGDNDSDPGEW